ncbi:hypothetical protein QFZ23_001932 [Arthrobacter globiformis]|uniref:hypothetical protein n=1 Tax=Arthrobacter globiformis TaxID=1665 RepID=UPI002781AA73|nr:hypothetical protein [Arthrobacter globiformis]MDQ1058031.1 hypothetical protein [Arthrobacter globiformis]
MTTNSPASPPEDEPQKDAQGKDDGAIPQGGDGIGITADAEPNTFEPEEDPDATEEPSR